MVRIDIIYFPYNHFHSNECCLVWVVVRDENRGVTPHHRRKNMVTTIRDN